MEEAMLVSELAMTPSEIYKLPRELIEKILIYKGVKNVTANGGDWQP
jgi:hypothetical protein